MYILCLIEWVLILVWISTAMRQNPIHFHQKHFRHEGTFLPVAFSKIWKKWGKETKLNQLSLSPNTQSCLNVRHLYHSIGCIYWTCSVPTELIKLGLLLCYSNICQGGKKALNADTCWKHTTSIGCLISPCISSFRLTLSFPHPAHCAAFNVRTLSLCSCRLVEVRRRLTQTLGKRGACCQVLIEVEKERNNRKQTYKQEGMVALRGKQTAAHASQVELHKRH